MCLPCAWVFLIYITHTQNKPTKILAHEQTWIISSFVCFMSRQVLSLPAREKSIRKVLTGPLAVMPSLTMSATFQLAIHTRARNTKGDRIHTVHAGLVTTCAPGTNRCHLNGVIPPQWREISWENIKKKPIQDSEKGKDWVTDICQMCAVTEQSVANVFLLCFIQAFV